MRLVAIILFTLGLLGCEPRHPDLHLPVGHPANPDAAAGRSITAPGALRPEVMKAEPAAVRGATLAPNPFSPTDRRQKSAAGHKH
jgi:hypothetical protein